MAKVDGDTDALVLVLLDSFDLAFAHRDGQSLTFADLDGRIGRALLFGKTQHILRDLFELILAMAEKW